MCRTAAAQGAGTPILLYDGWTGDLSLRCNGAAVDALDITSQPEMFDSSQALFPPQAIQTSGTSGRLWAFTNSSFDDFNFGPVLPAALQARVVEADIRGLVQYQGQSAWQGISVDLGTISPATPEPGGIALVLAVPLLLFRRRPIP